MQSIFLQTSKACATLVATVLIASALLSLSTPASAAAKQKDVVAACKRTSGCVMFPGTSGGVGGCSPTVCFSCTKGKCVAVTARVSNDGGAGDTISKLLSGQIVTGVASHHVGRPAGSPTTRGVVPGGGILEGDSGFGAQGPAASGVPLSTGRGSPSSGRIN
jgi:hypothetical protein